jgi:hypothetical protein
MDTDAVSYGEDFYAWTQAQAALLEARQFDALDLVNLVEEVVALGASERRALGSHLTILVLHLLKWCYQPNGRLTSHSWSDSIRNARLQLDFLLDASPSLRPLLPGMLTRYYPKARRLAADETQLVLTTFPEVCPWSLEHLLAYEFFPERPSL